MKTRKCIFEIEPRMYEDLQTCMKTRKEVGMDYFNNDRYEAVYDTNAMDVESHCCFADMVWDSCDEVYICTECGRKISRRDFLDEYVRAFGHECYSCRTNFPRCVICHLNHQSELDDYNILE